jgi:putative methionine-R-sulfoxide reductase with GAF domain
LDYDIAEQKIKKIISESDPSYLLQDCLEFLYEKFAKYSWAGIYLVKGNNLILGPWKGKQATEHTKIPIGKGVCGAAAKTGKTEIVSDVSTDARYLSCFASTRSEIVVPIKKNGKIIGEIDIDSDVTDAFDNQDAVFLEKIANMLSKYIL